MKKDPETKIVTPTILQMETVECGAACLGMILEYYGVFIPLEELRSRCGISRDGSKASNIVKAARELGLDAVGYNLEPSDLLISGVPAIIHWEFDHFVVFEGIRDGKVYINDPEYGPRKVTFAELDRLFTGIALIFKKNPNFKHIGRRAGLIRLLKDRLKKAKSSLAYLIVTGIFLVLPGLLVAAFLKIFIDNIIINKQIGWWKPLMLVMLITAIVQTVLVLLQQTTLLWIGLKVAILNSARFFHHLLRLPAEFFSQRYAGDIESRIHLNDRIAVIIFNYLGGAVLNIIIPTFLGLAMFLYNAPLAAASIVIISLNFVTLKYVSRKLADINQRLERESGKMIGNVMGGIQIIETLKATGNEQEFFNQIAGHQAKVLNSYSELSFWTQALSSVSPFLSTMSTIVILLMGGIFVMNGQMTFGILVAFKMLSLMFASPISRLVDLGGSLQEAKADIRRLDDIVNYKEEERYEVPEISGTDSQAKLTGDLELKDLTFGYSRLDAPLIRNINLKVKSGSRVALVGVSGSGKSTIAKLIMGLYEPWEGEILVGGRPLKTIPKNLLVDSFSMVSQDIYLFTDSVRNNITMWNDAIDEDTVIKAAKDAYFHDVAIQKHGGYGSIISENGANFSGGERQRLEIAMALANKPSFLILDEATSALDSYLEKAVDDNIRIRGLTCLIIAHRLSTIRDADEIIVMHLGKIVERGRHEELMALKGAYVDMIKNY